MFVCLFVGARLLCPCLLRISSPRVLMEAIPSSFIHKYNIEIHLMIFVFPAPVYFEQILLTQSQFIVVEVLFDDLSHEMSALDSKKKANSSTPFQINNKRQLIKCSLCWGCNVITWFCDGAMR